MTEPHPSTGPGRRSRDRRAAAAAGNPSGPDGAHGGRVDLVTPNRPDPDDALGPGRLDPLAVLVVYYVRRSSIPMIVLGLIVATIAGGVEEPIQGLASPREFVRALLSPWVVVVIAIVVRVGTGLLAFALAFPLSGSSGPSSYDGATLVRWSRAVSDRYQLTYAYRSLRWTWPVRERAVERVGRSGERLARLGPVLTVATVVLTVSWIITLAVVGV